MSTETEAPAGELLKSIGRGLPRSKFQRGSLTKVPRREGPGKRALWWMGRFLDYAHRNAKGKPKHKRVWLGRVAELAKSGAQKNLDALIGEALVAPAPADPDLTFEQWWNRWRELKEARWSRGTKRNVLPVFKNHILPAIGSMPLQEIKPERLQSLLNGLAERYSKSLIHTAATYLRGCLAAAVENDLLPRSPARRLEIPPSKKTPDGAYLSTDAIRRLSAELFGRDHLIFRLALSTAMRPGELFSLRHDDWDPVSSRLRIDETVYEGVVKAPKTPESNGWVFVPRPVAQELELWLQANPGAPGDWIFPSSTGQPFRHASYLKWILKPAALRAGIPRIDFRMLRRSCATHAQGYATIRDTASQMRHRDAAVTLKFYQKEIPESVRSAFTAMDDALFGNSSPEAVQ